MNNTFNFRRFAKYFAFDLHLAKERFGLTLLISGLLPIIFFVFYNIVSLIFNPRGFTLDFADAFRVIAFMCGIAVITFVGTAKVYGVITERSKGSEFILLPTSMFEKWLSMILNVCIVMPAVLFALLFASDTLLSLILPDAYGASIFHSELLRDILGEDGIAEVFNMPAMLWCSLTANMLNFTLGAIYFKKAKFGKTFLALFIIGLVLLSIGIPIALYSSFTWIQMIDESRINVALNLMQFIPMVVVAALIYVRIKTLKH